jgi:hypothetical protein
MVNKTYKVEDIFEDDPENEENVLMKIPEEISEQMGWHPGDVLRIKWGEGMILIEKVDNGEEQ